jgi:hypothetical protein
VRGFKVVGSDVIADPPLDWRSELARTERTMVQVLLDHGPVVDRATFERMCLSQGMKGDTFWQFLAYSPVITRLGPGVYGLRGADVPPGTVAALLRRPGKAKFLLDYGWTPDGKIWSAYKVTQYMISKGYFTVPASMVRVLAGEFDLRTADRVHLGTLAIGRAGGWGLREFFARRGGETGDYLSMLFDLGTKEVVVSIGDASLLADLSEPSAQLAMVLTPSPSLTPPDAKSA